jgi:hypothetical protein
MDIKTGAPTSVRALTKQKKRAFNRSVYRRNVMCNAAELLTKLQRPLQNIGYWYGIRVVWKLAGNFVARTVSKQQPQNTFVRL